MAARRARRASARVQVSSERGVFMISVAAELAEMHPQTLRMYEQRGLITPKRSPKGTRLYSHADVQQLRRIQELTAEAGHVMRFLSWDGYHHHLGINLLEGSGAAPVEPGVRGLQSFEIRRLDAARKDPNGIEVTPAA